MAKKKVTEKKKPGRPTPYRPEFGEIAKSMFLLGSTVEKVAEALGVHPDTIYHWKNTIPHFSVKMAEGREGADEKVAKALLKRATGFSKKAHKIQLDRNGVWQTKEYREYFPPDVNAAMGWLKNRRPDAWKEKLEIEQKNITVTVPGEQETLPE